MVLTEWFISRSHGAAWGFAGLAAFIAYRGVQQRRNAWLTVPALLLVSAGLIAQEIRSWHMSTYEPAE